MALLYYFGKLQSENLKIEAALHGAKIEGESTDPKAKADQIMFKDPKEYENLSPEERKKLTRKMLGEIGGMKLPGMGKLEKKRVKK